MNEYQSDANQDFRDYQADEYEQLQKEIEALNE